MKKKIKRFIEELKNEVSNQVDKKSLDKLKISFGLNQEGFWEHIEEKVELSS